MYSGNIYVKIGHGHGESFVEEVVFVGICGSDPDLCGRARLRRKHVLWYIFVTRSSMLAAYNSSAVVEPFEA